MNTLVTKFYCKIICIAISTTFLFLSCNSNRNKTDQQLQDSINISEINKKKALELQTAKQIFYSLPSPLETAMIIKESGTGFNPEVLNPVINVSDYNTSKKQALNLGIYSTDLSYASLFEQTQISIEYISAVRDMMEGIGISSAISNKTLQHLKHNINNRNKVLDILSESFLNSSAYLKENNRSALVSLTLVGGWIEGLYIAVNLVDTTNFHKSDLVKRIVDQKLCLFNVIRLLREYQSNPKVASVLADIYKIKDVYKEIDLTVTSSQVVKQDSSDVSEIDSKSNISIKRDTFIKLYNTVNSVRRKYTS